MRNWLELSKQNRNEQVVPPVPAWNPQNPTKTKIIFDTGNIKKIYDEMVSVNMIFRYRNGCRRLFGLINVITLPRGRFRASWNYYGK